MALQLDNAALMKLGQVQHKVASFLKHVQRFLLKAQRVFCDST